MSLAAKNKRIPPEKRILPALQSAASTLFHRCYSKTSQNVALPGDSCSLLVPFTIPQDKTNFVIEQFWGRAVQASCDSKESGALLICCPLSRLSQVGTEVTER